MQMNPQDKGVLEKYTKVAKKIVYNPERMKKFMRMLGTKEGAVTAVQTVVAAIDKLKPIPPQVLPMVAINTYMIMVDLAQDATGIKASPKILNEVIGLILQTAQGMTQQAQDQGPAPEAQPQGMLAQMQGAPAPQPEAAPEAAPEEMPDEGMLARMQRRGVPA